METLEEVIKIIKEDISKKSNKYIARKYYYYKPQFDDEPTSYVDTSGATVSIEKEYHQKLYTNYFKFIVDQKKNYLFVREPSIKENSKFSIIKIVDLLEDLLLNASLDSVSWMQFYINDNNDLDWMVIPDKEIIPFYDRYHKKLEKIIKYFLIDKDTFYVEYWTLEGLQTFKIYKDQITDLVNKSHFEVKTYYVEGEIEDTKLSNFKSLPFIPLFNNKNHESDLSGIQELLDMYNSINSGFIENINVFQEFMMKLTGFSTSEALLEEVMKNARKHKSVSLPEGADADYLSVEIPVEARKVILEILKDNIFIIASAFDPTRIGEGNVTNVLLVSRQQDLNIKASNTEKQIKIFYEKFINFINSFYNTNFDDKIDCNKNQISNITETIKNCVDSIGILSLETIIDNHPFTTSTKEELKRINAEKAAIKPLDTTNSSGL